MSGKNLAESSGLAEGDDLKKRVEKKDFAQIFRFENQESLLAEAEYAKR